MAYCEGDTFDLIRKFPSQITYVQWAVTTTVRKPTGHRSHRTVASGSPRLPADCGLTKSLWASSSTELT
jgi:hypothetical protein